MPAIRLCFAAAALAAYAAPASAQDPAADSPPSAVDYAGFLELSAELLETRQQHLVGWTDFSRMAREEGALILDTRSAAAFAMGHIEGAVNLPFSEFTDDKLAEVIGPDRERAILIYCNNNFADNVPPVPLKRMELALNIPTFINLHGYGYTNVWELASLMSITDPRLSWVSQMPGEAS